jgi:hypothetical protein
VGNSHELVQGQPAQDGVEGEVDLRNIENDALRAVVIRCPQSHWEGDATVCHTPVSKNETKFSIHVPRMFKSHI